MRFSLVVAAALASTACGGGSDADRFAAGNSELSEAQIDAALGPADQSTVEDAAPIAVENAGNADAAANSEAPSDEDEE